MIVNTHSVDDIFARCRAPFAVVRDGKMQIADNSYTQLTLQIHELKPVRKLFQNRQLRCYSHDGHRGMNGKLCELCPNRTSCRKRLQLRIAYFDGTTSQAAILELSGHTFPAFDQVLREAGSVDNLIGCPINVKVINDDQGRSTLEFHLVS